MGISFHKQTAPFLFGVGAAGLLYEQLKRLGAAKAVICTDKGVVSAGVADKATASLKENGFPFVIFDGCLPDAPETSFYGAADLVRDEGADVLVAVGGGSNMDAAKCASILIKDNKTIEELQAISNPTMQQTPDVKLVLMPTTSGTGSEETAVGVVSKSDTHEKFGVFITGVDLTIIDPELASGMPPGLTASTGMDTIAHAVEAFTTTSVKNPVSDQRALAAMRLAYRWLPVAVRDGSDLEARTNMCLACVLAGMAFNDSMNNFGHGIAHALGTKSHLAHGLGCALAEPAALESFSAEIPELIRTIGLEFGADIRDDDSPEEIGKKTGDALRKLMKEIGIPSLEDLGLSRDEVMAHKEAVMEEFQTHLAPITVTPEIVETVLASMYDDYR
jgi:alcohol dehydrogenase class IV